MSVDRTCTQGFLSIANVCWIRLQIVLGTHTSDNFIHSDPRVDKYPELDLE